MPPQQQATKEDVTIPIITIVDTEETVEEGNGNPQDGNCQSPTVPRGTGRRNSSDVATQLQLQTQQRSSWSRLGVLRRSSQRHVLRERRKSFIVEFSAMQGPPQIAFLMALLAIGLGCTIGIVPEVMIDRFARLYHGYTGTATCDTFVVEDLNKPLECTLGANDAQAAASKSNLIQNILTFCSASLMGSLSDEYGRKGTVAILIRGYYSLFYYDTVLVIYRCPCISILTSFLALFSLPIACMALACCNFQNDEIGPLVLGLVMAMIPSLCLYLMNYLPLMNPWWYYTTSASQGLMSWMAIALSSLNDVLPKEFRAAGIGLLFAGFLLGISFAPTIALLLPRTTLCLVSFVIVAVGGIVTVVCVPETLAPTIAHAAKRRRLEREHAIVEHETTIRHQLAHQYHQQQQQQHPVSGASVLWLQCQQWYYGSTSSTCRGIKLGLRTILLRPLEEMSILNRNVFFRILTALAFFTGMVQSSDQVLLLYYLEEHLDFKQQDVSIMFLIFGVTGIIVQVFVMKPLNDCVGEKMIIAFAFGAGATVNFLYGIAQHKSTIFAALILSGLTTMAFPTISAIKANNVGPTEQGRIQGALYSVKALASGVGPAVLQAIYSRTNTTDHNDNTHNSSWFIGPGTMWFVASFLFLIAVGLAITLPNDKANTSVRHGGRGDDEDIVTDRHDADGNTDTIGTGTGTTMTAAMMTMIAENELEEYRQLVSDDEDEDSRSRREDGRLSPSSSSSSSSTASSVYGTV